MRRSIATLLVLAGLALLPGACRPKPQGAVRVTVIGDPPKVRDPAVMPLSAPDAVLIASVGQGLVRFDAGGNIVSGLAERWNVSDDGLSYIFRIASSEWPDGRKITAPQVARILKRSTGSSSANPLRDTLGAVDDIVAMTDRVIEIRLTAPRPNLLNILAQPEFSVVRNDDGQGPFIADPVQGSPGVLRLTRRIASPDEESSGNEQVLLNAARVQQAVRSFAAGDTDLVLGGTFADLPYAQRMELPRSSLRFDPASGLFGLMPTHSAGIFDDPEVRNLLSQSIDRDLLVEALRVPGLAARATLLESGLDGIPDPVPPVWATTPLADRRAALAATAARLFGTDMPTIRVLLPEGPGGELVFNRLSLDWGAIGLTVERADNAASADLKLVDSVAPSTSPAWFLRQFRCDVAPVCDAEADKLLEAARDTAIPQQRYALLARAAALLDGEAIFIPIAAPVRWSLVSARIQGFAGNRYARHTLTDLEQKPSAGGP